MQVGPSHLHEEGQTMQTAAQVTFSPAEALIAWAIVIEFVVAIIMFCAVFFRSSKRYRSAGTTKGRWMAWWLASVLPTVILLPTTIVFAFVFFLGPARQMPKRTRAQREYRPSPGWTEYEPYRSSYPAPPSQRRSCQSCSDGTEACFQCVGGLVPDGSGNMIRHNACNMGRRPCSRCKGSRYES
jgi:hypothetical protein